jgi:hypothetical protein
MLKIKQAYAAHLKNVAHFHVQYEVNFYGCFPKCFCMCICRPINGCRESTEIIIIQFFVCTTYQLRSVTSN